MTKPSILSPIVRRMLLAPYCSKGWKLAGSRPDCRKFIIVGAPHTPNRDFIFFNGVPHEPYADYIERISAFFTMPAKPR